MQMWYFEWGRSYGAGRRVAVNWPSHGRRVAVNWPSRGRQLAVAWPSRVSVRTARSGRNAQ